MEKRDWYILYGVVIGVSILYAVHKKMDKDNVAGQSNVTKNFLNFADNIPSHLSPPVVLKEGEDIVVTPRNIRDANHLNWSSFEKFR